MRYAVSEYEHRNVARGNESKIIIMEFNLGISLIKILMAAVCGGAIGANRDLNGYAAGIRTHMLVCIGSTLTIITGYYVCYTTGLSSDPVRIGAQVISGIGFLGVAIIMVKGGSNITGLTTAAGIWVTATIGLAIGAGCYLPAILVTAIAFLVIIIFKNLEGKLRSHSIKFELYIEISGVDNVRQMIEFFEHSYNPHRLFVTPPRTAAAGNVGMEITFLTKSSPREEEIKKTIQEHENVVFVMRIA